MKWKTKEYLHGSQIRTGRQIITKITMYRTDTDSRIPIKGKLSLDRDSLKFMITNKSNPLDMIISLRLVVFKLRKSLYPLSSFFL